MPDFDLGFVGLTHVGSLGPENPGSYGLVGTFKLTLEPFEPDTDERDNAAYHGYWMSSLTRDLPVAWPKPMDLYSGPTVHLYTSFDPASAAAANQASHCLQAIQPALDAHVRFTCDDGPDADPTVEQWQLSRLLVKLHHPKGHVQSDHVLALTPAEYTNLFRLKSILCDTLLAFNNLPPSAHLNDNSTVKVDQASYSVSVEPKSWCLSIDKPSLSHALAEGLLSLSLCLSLVYGCD